MAEPIGSGHGHRAITRRTVLQLGGMAAVVPFLPGMIAPSPAAAAVMSAGSEALTAAGPGDALPAGSLRYTAPATAWESQALPIGNGRLGAMMFAGTTEELIQFNENSLWGGLNDYDNALAGQPDSAYDTSITGFGSYRDFGAVRVALGAVTRVTAPGGPYQDSSSGETVAQTYDGRTTTKWCIIGPPSHVIWQAELATPQATASYSLTSANDVPERDPQQWTLSGSDDGAAWTPLDARTGAPFEQRGMTKTYTFANTTAYRFYRLDFVPKAGVSHFQIAEIALAGISLAPAAPVAGYRRSLDPRTGVHESRFSTTGGTMTREALASRDPDVLVFRYETDDPDGFTAVISLTSAQGAATTADAAAARLGFAGEMANRLGYAATLRIADTDGTVTATGAALRVARASRMTLLLDARTNYRLSAADGWRGEDPQRGIDASLTAAAALPYADVRAAHVERFAEVMDRASITWGESAPAVLELPVDQRLTRYAGGGDDPSLEQALVGYGRYLLASTSRPGGLPANLQGLWNDSNTPAWASDYHTNINVQMNYWGAETMNLSETHEALAEFIRQVAVPSRVATRNAFGQNVRGWTARTSQSIFGGNSWEWNTVSSAWYALHLYEHWAFTQDLSYLRDLAYPLIKEICEFWQDRLKALPDGTLVSPLGWSPEHGPREDGVMHDQQIVWDLFQNYLDCADALGVDADERATVADLQARLAPNRIGSWGQLQEWQTDRDDPADTHRHTSHLFAVYPGRQITSATPELQAAALVSLKARCNEQPGVPFTESSVIGDSRRSWTWPWRAALFARLGDGDRARSMLRGLLRYNTLSNLYATHPPFQIDGNLGIVGAVAEFVLQSHEGFIHLLPALPTAWPAGAFAGLRARGGYEVSAEWADGKVTSFQVVADRAPHSRPIRVRVNGQDRIVQPALTASGTTQDLGDWQTPAVTTSVDVRCTGPRAVLAVTATNLESVPTDITITTAYGARTFTAVKPGGNAFHAFTTRARTIPAGSVAVTRTATIDGVATTNRSEVAYSQSTC
ncbi:glycosyl hydrolase family 95 catalytic domain-containing protein [Microbacterium algeriense]|uniref:glycosyl hydrolase family 95 catalytic domain-containing protein n=1 Tax=Microbacterium algeriense TaxID=2615184 RepID=UPI0022DFDA27|nr:glycoside hydrolase N-terminal domain-containing protein [Microbacterium algeriense]